MTEASRRAPSRHTISAERQLELYNRSPVVVYACEACGEFAATHIGPGIRNQLGWEPQEFLRTPGFWADNIHPDDRERVFADLETLFAAGRHVHEYRFRHKDGSYRWMRDEMILERDRSGAPTQIIGYWTDVTERKLAEEALGRNDATLRLITDSVPAMIGYVGRDERIAFANRQYADWFELSPDEILGRHIREVWGAQRYERNRSYVAQAFSGQEVTYEGARGVHGEIRNFRATYIPHLGDDGETLGYFALAFDTTESRQREQALRQVEERFARVVENSPSAIFLKDLDGRFVLVNNRFEEWYGVSAADVAGKTSFDVYPAEFAAQYVAQDREVIETGGTREREMAVPFADGTIHSVIVTKFPVVDADGRTIGVGTINTDVTEYRNMEHQLRQAQKMEAVGQLTGGVAHDFNNLLTVVLGNLQLAQGMLDRDSPAHAALKTAVGAVLRAADLTQRLLAFSRRQPLSPAATDVNALVADMTELLQRTLGEQIEIGTVAERGMGLAMVDGAQLENALLNIALNSRDAMADGGTLLIETADAVLDEDYGRTNPDVAPGRYVMVAVTDSGAGMTREVLDQVFDPFFTTKDVGKGTGLGLSMVYGFMKQSGGHVTIDSEPGEGTTVKLYLPSADGVSASEFDPGARAGGLTGSETVLVVEDDPGVRSYVTAVLGALGYEVLEAADGPSALAILDDGVRIDLVFTDIVLPHGMNGREVAETAQRRRPGIRVLYTSGYTENAVVHDGRLDEGIDLLFKPYTRDELARSIRGALDRDGG